MYNGSVPHLPSAALECTLSKTLNELAKPNVSLFYLVTCFDPQSSGS